MRMAREAIASAFAIGCRGWSGMLGIGVSQAVQRSGKPARPSIRQALAGATYHNYMNKSAFMALARQHVKKAESNGMPSSRENGFTIIEAMVVVAIIAVLASLVAPSFRNMILSNRAAGAAAALQVSLNLARSEAVRRGSDARVTIAANTTAGQWSNGWTVFVDKTTTANNAVAPTADDATVTRVEVATAQADVSFGQTGTLNYFIYNGMGRMIDVNGSAVANRTFWFYADTSNRYCLIVNNTGRVRVAKVASGVTCPTA